MNSMISHVMLAFLLVGALDYICGSRFGLGEEFTKGLMTSGRLLLCMTGFITLAPALALAMADSREAGLFNGMIVGASIGTTVMFHIPLVMSNATKENLPAALLAVFGSRVVPAFSAVGHFLELVSMVGLCCAAVKQMVGVELLAGRA